MKVVLHQVFCKKSLSLIFHEMGIFVELKSRGRTVQDSPIYCILEGVYILTCKIWRFCFVCSNMGADASSFEQNKLNASKGSDFLLKIWKLKIFSGKLRAFDLFCSNKLIKRFSLHFQRFSFIRKPKIWVQI